MISDAKNSGRKFFCIVLPFLIGLAVVVCFVVAGIMGMTPEHFFNTNVTVIILALGYGLVKIDVNRV